jgi:hypothetical protein
MEKTDDPPQKQETIHPFEFHVQPLVCLTRCLRSGWRNHLRLPGFLNPFEFLSHSLSILLTLWEPTCQFGGLKVVFPVPFQVAASFNSRWCSDAAVLASSELPVSSGPAAESL